MKILAVLWTVYLIRFCSAIWCCGKSKTTDNDNGAYGESTENLGSNPLQPTVVPAGQSTAEESPKPTAPVTLDLANPDKSKVEIREDLTGGVSYRGFVPKNIFHISSVTYGDKELWTASEGEEFTFAGSSTKENSSLITIGISKGDGSKLDFKHFEKNADGKWTSMTEKDDFFNKLEELSKQELSPTEEPTSPSQ